MTDNWKWLEIERLQREVARLREINTRLAVEIFQLKTKKEIG